MNLKMKEALEASVAASRELRAKLAKLKDAVMSRDKDQIVSAAFDLVGAVPPSGKGSS